MLVLSTMKQSVYPKNMPEAVWRVLAVLAVYEGISILKSLPSFTTSAGSNLSWPDD